MVLDLSSLALGMMSGYFYGLSLAGCGKALSFSYSTPFLRVACIGFFGYVLLHWGQIPFILFVGSLIITMWIVILTHNE